MNDQALSSSLTTGSALCGEGLPSPTREGVPSRFPCSGASFKQLLLKTQLRAFKGSQNEVALGEVGIVDHEYHVDGAVLVAVDLDEGVAP